MTHIKLVIAIPILSPYAVLCHLVASLPAQAWPDWQAIKECDTSWRQTIQRPGLDGIACKSIHAIEPEMNRPVFIAPFPGCDKGNLVL